MSRRGRQTNPLPAHNPTQCGWGYQYLFEYPSPKCDAPELFSPFWGIWTATRLGIRISISGRAIIPFKSTVKRKTLMPTIAHCGLQLFHFPLGLTCSCTWLFRLGLSSVCMHYMRSDENIKKNEYVCILYRTRCAWKATLFRCLAHGQSCGILHLKNLAGVPYVEQSWSLWRSWSPYCTTGSLRVHRFSPVLNTKLSLWRRFPVNPFFWQEVP